MAEHPRRARIAVVDDDPGMLESIASLLNSADYEVHLFSSAAAALENGDVLDVDCLISDVAMPLMDGFALARTVQAAQPTLPIILITARPELLGRSALAGLSQYRVFRKPFDGQALLAAVGAMVTIRRPRSPQS